MLDRSSFEHCQSYPTFQHQYSYNNTTREQMTLTRSLGNDTGQRKCKGGMGVCPLQTVVPVEKAPIRMGKHSKMGSGIGLEMALESHLAHH